MARSADMAGSSAVPSDGQPWADLQPHFRKLKPGPGHSATQVSADQRRRLHAAAIALAEEGSLRGVRMRALVRAAGVSSATFYRHFADIDDCFGSACEAVMATALRRAAAAQEGLADWRISLHALIGTFLQDLGQEQRTARFALVDIFGAGPQARRRAVTAVGHLEGLVAATFSTAPPTMTPPRHLVAGMTAGVLRVARNTVRTGRTADLPELVAEVVDWMLALVSPHVLSLRTAAVGTYARPEALPDLSETAPWKEGVGGDDRERILRATIALLTEGGLKEFTTTRLRNEARVPRRRFDQQFECLEECILEALEMVAGAAAARARSYSLEVDSWELETCRFIRAICTEAARNRAEACLAFLGVSVGGCPGLTWRERMIGQAATALRMTVPGDRRPSPIVTEASLAAAWHIVQRDIADHRVRGLPTVAPLLSYVILAPIVGSGGGPAAGAPEPTLVQTEARSPTSYP